MQCFVRMALVACQTVLAGAVLLLSHVTADDWPMFGREASHNGVSPESNPPRSFNVGEFDRKTGAWQRDKARNVKWQAPLGTNTFGDPVVAGGLVWVGINNTGAGNDAVDASVLACFRESDGQPLYRFVSPRLPHGRNHDWPLAAMSCSPLVEGERMWLATNRAEVICFDIGPLVKGEPQPRQLWKVDMMGDLGVRPSGSRMGLCHTCSIASCRDWIYVITGNGIDESNTKITAPDAPSLLCLSKKTGEVVWQDKSPGADILEGQWSSPLVIESGGRPQVIAAQGDGWMRSFDAVSGELLWKFDVNFKASHFEHGGRGSRNTFLGSPVYDGGYVYIASGQQPEHGEGPGRLVCINPMKTGDVSSELAVDGAGDPIWIGRSRPLNPEKGERAIANPNSGLVWDYVQHDRNGDGKFDFDERLHRSVSNVAIKDDLLIAADFPGLVHCLDAKTGRLHWTFDTLSAVFASPLIVDGVVYVADEDGDVALFRLSADPAVAMLNGNPLSEFNVGNSIYCSPVFANGTLYVASRDRLLAIKDDGSLPAGDWSQWRGPERDNISVEWGLLQEWPVGGPPLVWRTDGIGQGIASTAVVGDAIYTLGSSGSDEHVIALDQATGQLRWKSAIGPAINDAPLMRWLSQRTPTVDGERLFVSTFDGKLVCLQTADGKELWRKDFVKDFGGLPRTWGIVDYPLVAGDRLICTPGGSEATVAALNKRTGEVIWKCLLDPPEKGSYAAPILVERQYQFSGQCVAVLNDCLIGVQIGDGKLLWRQEAKGLGWITSMTPLVADGFLILPGGRSAPDLVVFQFQNKGEQIKEFSRTPLRVDHFMDASMILGDYLYTVDQSSIPICVNWRTGETTWRVRAKGGGKIALTYADQRLYLLRGDGTMLLTDASPRGYQERGQFTLPDHQPAVGGTFPVITGGRMYVRDNDHLFCYDLRAGGSQPPLQPRMTQLSLTSPVNGSEPSRPLIAKKQPNAIFVPTPHDVVAKMLKLADVKPTDTVFDLGSGDGRIVIAAAKTYGAKAIGLELDQELVRQSREKIIAAGLEALVQIEQRDLFMRELSNADVITLYLPTNLMDQLLPQLAQVKRGTRIVSHFFKFTDIPPETSQRFESSDDGDTHEIYLWTAPLHKGK